MYNIDDDGWPLAARWQQASTKQRLPWFVMSWKHINSCFPCPYDRGRVYSNDDDQVEFNSRGAKPGAVAITEPNGTGTIFVVGMMSCCDRELTESVNKYQLNGGALHGSIGLWMGGCCWLMSCCCRGLVNGYALLLSSKSAIMFLGVQFGAFTFWEALTTNKFHSKI